MIGGAILRPLKKVASTLVLLALAAAAVGYALQERRDARILAENPPPGDFVDVNGHALHYRLLGDGPITFVLEAGAGEYGTTWNGLEEGLARIGRVFAYDRLGLGWSEEGPHPRTIPRIVGELRTALERADVPPPYVLVGHSLGGAIATFYAMEHPTEVAGLLLIDPSHKDQIRKLPQRPAWQRGLAIEFMNTAPLGLPRLLFDSDEPMKNLAKYFRTFGAEYSGLVRAADERAEMPIDLGATPIYVLTRARPTTRPGDTGARPESRWEIWRSLHAELVEASASDVRRQLIVEGAGHYIHYDRPDVVVEAAEELVGRIKGDS